VQISDAHLCWGISAYTKLVACNHTLQLHDKAAIWQYGIADICLFQGKDQTDLPPNLNRSLSHSFTEHYNDTSLSDVIFKAGDCQVHAHKIILAAQSPSFEAMFQVQLWSVTNCNATSLLTCLLPFDHSDMALIVCTTLFTITLLSL